MIQDPTRHVGTSILKVSAKSNPNSVAGALAAVLRERETVEMQAVGAGAINQAVKAIAIARRLSQKQRRGFGLHSFFYRGRNRRQRTHRHFAGHRTPRAGALARFVLVDFHSHTWESDGSLSPPALTAMMRERGVGIFSITDHDTLAAYDDRGLCMDGVRIVTGIEINTTFDDGEVHVLGYRLPIQPSPLTAVLERNRTARRERVGRIVAQLNAAGYAVTMDHVHAEAKEGAALGRPHVGKALVRLGIASNIEDAFRAFLRRGRPGYVPSTHITPHEAIDVIVASGGVAVLAHPGRLRDYAIIGELAECGLRGLEVFYPTHEPMQVQYFRETAQRHGLVMTAGSDFHDIRYHKRGVGAEVDEADIRAFLDLVA